MKRILGFLRPLKKYAVISVLLTVLGQGAALLLPLIMSMIVNNGVSQGDLEYIKKFGLLMIVIAAAGLGISILNSYFTSRLSSLYGRNLREMVFLKTESLSLSNVDDIGTNSLITRSTNDIKQIQDFVLIGLRMILSAPVMLIGGTIMAFIMNARLAVYVFSVVPIIGVIVALLMKYVMPMFRRRQKLTDKLNRLIREKLSGIRVIRAFNKSDYEDEKFNVGNAELAGLSLKIARLFAALIPVCISLAFAGVSALIWVAAKNIDRMTEISSISNTIGDLQAFMVYMIMIVAALGMAASMFVIVPRANISAKRILEVLDTEATVSDPENAVPVSGSEVEFRNVFFSYPGSSAGSLSDVSFIAKPGQTTAIIGGTGSGKSTIVNLIPRFYDVTSGAVLVGGTDVREMKNEELCSLIGYIPQTASLFSGTIADNIRFGKKDATDEEVLAALRTACAEDFVTALPEGINSHVSQSGTNFSGGQKQRLSIARAIVRRAGIYIFDDSFSALDFRTDTLVRNAVRKELSGATVIIVAQRVGTVLDADNIIVLDNGKIAGSGTHNELLRTCEIYREIVRSQQGDEYADKEVPVNG